VSNDDRRSEEMLISGRLEPRFWERFGLERAGPDFTDKKVLELGCGTGWRCLQIAARGARRVIGIDPYEPSIRSAVENLKKFQNLAGIVDYRVMTIHEVEERDIDVVVSESTFEHVLDVPEVLASIRKILRPGGQAIIGFGPLYHSPFGDHGWMQAALPGGQRFWLPWGHILVPERWLFRRMEARYGKPVRSTADWPFLTLNKKTVREYHRFFQNCSMRVILERRNTSFRLVGKIGAAVGRLPILSRYLTRYMYYILQKPMDDPPEVSEVIGRYSESLTKGGKAAQPAGPVS
jgi:SAM-dependent methyltransferase